MRRPARPALTLVEVLAVIVVLSLVAGLGGVGLAAGEASARLREAASAWRDLDARARLLARSAGPVVMVLAEDQTAVGLHVRNTGERFAEVVLPPGAQGEIESGGPTRSVTFDRLGRSPDYEVRLTAGDRTEAWSVMGLTGRITEERP